MSEGNEHPAPIVPAPFQIRAGVLYHSNAAERCDTLLVDLRTTLEHKAADNMRNDRADSVSAEHVQSAFDRLVPKRERDRYASGITGLLGGTFLGRLASEAIGWAKGGEADPAVFLPLVALTIVSLVVFVVALSRR